VPDFEFCTFRENTADEGGAACMFLGYRPPVSSHCYFADNSTAGTAEALWFFAVFSDAVLEGSRGAGRVRRGDPLVLRHLRQAG
jgi:hypothetical protein